MFPRIDATFRSCRQHLDTTGTRGTEIETIIVGYMLTIIHSEFEQYIVSLVCARCSVPDDPRLSSFAGYAAKRLVKKIALSELTSTLNTFHADCKKQFSDGVLNTQHHLAYDNIETNRQMLAHSSGINMTFAELEAAYNLSLIVLTAFAEALTL